MKTTPTDMHRIVQEQKAYYDARAAEYNDWWLRKGEFKSSEEQDKLWREEGQQITSELSAFITGTDLDILELAPGTGNWSSQLYQKGRRLTLIDSSAAMLNYNPIKENPDVQIIIADLLNWHPVQTYDAVFMGFWISHIPQVVLSHFVENVAKSLKEGGKVFFVDNKRKPIEQKPHVVKEFEEFAVRKLGNGQQFTIVKNYYEPAFLVELFRQHSMAIEVNETANFFQYGHGHRTNN